MAGARTGKEGGDWFQRASQAMPTSHHVSWAQMICAFAHHPVCSWMHNGHISVWIYTIESGDWLTILIPPLHWKMWVGRPQAATLVLKSCRNDRVSAPYLLSSHLNPWGTTFAPGESVFQMHRNQPFANPVSMQSHIPEVQVPTCLLSKRSN